MTIPQLPLTPNGKLDRAKLPSPQPKQETARKHVAPKSEAEKVLADVWTQILGLKDVGVDDNFFELGGDSLMLLRVQNAINQRLRRDIPVTVLFRFPTIRALSAYLAEGQRTDFLVFDEPRRGTEEVIGATAGQTGKRRWPRLVRGKMDN